MRNSRQRLRILRTVMHRNSFRRYELRTVTFSLFLHTLGPLFQQPRLPSHLSRPVRSADQQGPFAADDTPTELDALLAELDSALTAVLDILGPVLGFTREKTEAIEADIDRLIADIEAIEHGHIDVDNGLEVVLQDIVDMLHDFGFKSTLGASGKWNQQSSDGSFICC